MATIKELQEQFLERIKTSREAGDPFHVETHTVNADMSDRDFRLERDNIVTAITAYGFTISNWVDTEATGDDPRSQSAAVAWSTDGEAEAAKEGFIFA